MRLAALRSSVSFSRLLSSASKASARVRSFCSCAFRISVCSSGEWPISSCSASRRRRSRSTSASARCAAAVTSASAASSSCRFAFREATLTSSRSSSFLTSSSWPWSTLSTASSPISAGDAAFFASSWTCRSSSTISGSAPAVSLPLVSSHSFDTFFTSARASCSCRSMSTTASSCRRRSRVSSWICRSTSAICSSRLISPSAA
mmetsp:Transcript_16212/g.48719  ORF Transcript_16212/g.48719 Transcript_16212/m.48719 type:complete len:204 (-) Transcript_16212:1582-2193(-)